MLRVLEYYDLTSSKDWVRTRQSGITCTPYIAIYVQLHDHDQVAVQSQRVAETISLMYEASNNNLKAYCPRAERTVVRDGRVNNPCMTLDFLHFVD